MPDEILKLKDAANYSGWATVEGRIFALNESSSEKVQQSGMMSDGTGVARFVIFVSSEIESLEYDRSYRLESVFVELWIRQVSIKINRRTTITQIPDIDLAAAKQSDSEDKEIEAYDDDPYARHKRKERAARAVKAGQQTIFMALT